jgi:hypothetical protein
MQKLEYSVEYSLCFGNLVESSLFQNIYLEVVDGNVKMSKLTAII